MLSIIKFFWYRRKWRKKNSHNETWMKRPFDMNRVFVGKATYGPLLIYSADGKTKVKIGNYCSIGPNVTFIAGNDHRMDTLSTYPFKARLLKLESADAISKGDIYVGDDVWIGANSTILSGTTLGQGSVIAAGSLVNTDIPPYAVAGGVPARVIKYRFEEDLIEKLIEIDFNKLSKEDVEKHLDELYEALENSLQIEWLPRKG